MAHITKVSVIEMSTIIWEFDPSLPGNSLDDIAAIQTVAIKVQVSGQHIKYFHRLQVQCNIKTPLKILLHGNMRCGSAFGMLYKLRKAVNMFLSSADELYGENMMVHKNNCILKKIPWTTFKLDEDDWGVVYDAKLICVDSQ